MRLINMLVDDQPAYVIFLLTYDAPPDAAEEQRLRAPGGEMYEYLTRKGWYALPEAGWPELRWDRYPAQGSLPSEAGYQVTYTCRLIP